MNIRYAWNEFIKKIKATQHRATYFYTFGQFFCKQKCNVPQCQTYVIIVPSLLSLSFYASLLSKAACCQMRIVLIITSGSKQHYIKKLSIEICILNDSNGFHAITGHYTQSFCKINRFVILTFSWKKMCSSHFNYKPTTPLMLNDSIKMTRTVTLNIFTL